MKLFTFLLFIIGVNLCSCGSLGHIQFYYFNAPKYEVEKDLLNVINRDSAYVVPDKWKDAAQSYDFLDERFLYFKTAPQEMYEIGFNGDSSQWNHQENCTLALVALFKGDKFQFDRNLSSREEKRMEKRFETEILSKMKYQYSKDN